jgi:tRNA 5-methylaminomethyl-2-thiouridine biosynthesis bifunctional protein
VLQLAFNAKEAERQLQLAEAFPEDLVHWLDQPQAQALAGIGLAHGGLYYPEGGWVHPPALCQWQAAQPDIQVLRIMTCSNCARSMSGKPGTVSDCSPAHPVVILAGAAEIQRFPESAGLPLKRIRGQITRLVQTPQSQALNTVVCAEGYVAPARLGEHTLGASFDFNSDDLTPTTAEHLGNLAMLEEISHDLVTRLQADQLDPESLQGRAAFRCTSPDYLPIVGPLADTQAFAQAYAALGKDARQVPDVECPWHDGLYVNSGHGSRGLITAPLSGELLAAWLDNEPLPLAQKRG